MCKHFVDYDILTPLGRYQFVPVYAYIRNEWPDIAKRWKAQPNQTGERNKKKRRQRIHLILFNGKCVKNMENKVLKIFLWIRSFLRTKKKKKKKEIICVLCTLFTHSMSLRLCHCWPNTQNLSKPI